VSTEDERRESCWATIGLPDELRAAPARASLRASAALGTGPTMAAPSSDRASGNASADLAPLPLLRLESAGALAADLEVLGTLGEGGMGVVQRARQRSLDREVAIKRMKRTGQASAVRSLLTEARTSGALEHPNIVPIHALGRDDSGDPVLVMKRVEGVAWSVLIADDDHPRWAGEPADHARWHLEVAVQVCRALELAHDRGVVHRDLKPDNVMIGRFGEVYVLDWGLACRAQGRDDSPAPEPGGGLVGTPAYMAPEMVRGAPITERTDVYLLGGILHEIALRRAPHAGDHLFAMLQSIAVPHERDLGGAPPELAGIIARALAHAPEDRFASVREVREALADHLRHRDSDVLVDEALARLRVVEQAVEASGDPASVRAAFGECRFGLQQALRIWEDGPRARAALERALRAMATLELAHGGLDAAGALLDEMREPDAELAKRLTDARAARERAAVEADALRADAADRDIAADAAKRWRATMLLTVLTSLAVLLSLAALRLGYIELTYANAMLAVPVPIVLLGIVAWRSRGRGNRAHWRMLGSLGALFLTGPVARFIGWRFDVPITTTLAFEITAFFLGAVLIGLAQDRLFYRAAALLGVTLVLILGVPAWTIELAIIGTIGALSIIALGWRGLAERAKEQPDRSTPNG
jgi:tRNA A-37 threonylcarbamoyl transferase component Bud32